MTLTASVAVAAIANGPRLGASLTVTVSLATASSPVATVAASPTVTVSLAAMLTGDASWTLTTGASATVSVSVAVAPG